MRIGGRLWTRPLASGLLPGVFRADLLEAGEVHERRVSIAELLGAEEVFLVSSVREWIRAVVVD